MRLDNPFFSKACAAFFCACLFPLCCFGLGYGPFDIRLRTVMPEKEAELEACGMFSVSGDEGFYVPMAASDRILAMSRIGSPYRIAAVDTEDGSILGEYLTDCEMSSIFSECQYRVEAGNLLLYLHDFIGSKFCSLDLTESVRIGSGVAVPLGKIPDGVTSVTFLSDSANLLYRISRDGTGFLEKIGPDGNILESSELFPEAGFPMLKTLLACRLSPDAGGTKAAIAMTFLPVLGIIDLPSGEIRYVQYETDFDTERVFRGFYESGEYPGDEFVSRLFTNDRVVCIVRTCLSDSDDDRTEVLLFGWDGTFRYRFCIGKTFTSTALDFRDSVLYGGEGQSMVYVYGLNGCL